MDDRIGGSSDSDSHQHIVEKDNNGVNQYTCGCQFDKRIVLVSIKVLDNQVDLFDKEFRDHDSKSLNHSFILFYF